MKFIIENFPYMFGLFIGIGCSFSSWKFYRGRGEGRLFSGVVAALSLVITGTISLGVAMFVASYAMVRRGI